MLESFIIVFFLIAILLIFGTAAWAGLIAAPFVPTKRRDIERLLKLAEVKKDDKVYDLGSGDGRIAIAAAEQFGAKVEGIEISLLPYIFSKILVRIKGLQKKVSIHYGDFFQVNLKKADVVICFLTPKAMKKLKPKFKKELTKNTRIVSYAFPLLDWTPKYVHKPQKGDISVYLYEN